MQIGGFNHKVTRDMMIALSVLLIFFGFFLYHRVGTLGYELSAGTAEASSQ